MRVPVVAVMVALLAAACADGATTTSLPPPTTTPPSTLPTSTLPTSTLPTSTVPAATPLVEGIPAALVGYDNSRAHLIGWRDGWLRLATTWDPPALADDPELRGLFGVEVLDALDAAGATTIEDAYLALSAVGLLPEVLDTLAANPGLLDRIVAGSGGTRATAETTSNGQDWTAMAIDLPGADHGLREAWSDGEMIVVLLGDSRTGGPVVNTTTDLVTWHTHVLDVDTSSGMFRAAIGDDSWYLLYSAYGLGEHRAWVGDRTGALSDAPVPASGECCVLTRTSAGYLAASAEEDGPATVWFSADGQVWSPRPGPGDTPVASLAPVVGGVLATTFEHPETVVWKADPEGADWTRIDLPFEAPGRGVHFDTPGLAVSAINLTPIDRGSSPTVISYAFTVAAAEGTLAIEIDVDAQQVTLRVTDPTGEVVLDVVGGSEVSGLVSIADGVAVVIDEQGRPVLTLDAEEFLAANAAAEMAARAGDPASGFFAPISSWWIVATDDGVDWEIVDLPDPVGNVGRFEEFPVASGSRILFEFEEEWLVIDLG